MLFQKSVPAVPGYPGVGEPGGFPSACSRRPAITQGFSSLCPKVPELGWVGLCLM